MPTDPRVGFVDGVWSLFAHRPTESGELRERWEARREELLAEFVAEHPGHRPLGWWLYESPGPRVCSAGCPRAEVYWRQFPGAHAEFACPGELESQPAYLVRHRLMPPDERRRVPAGEFRPLAQGWEDSLDDGAPARRRRIPELNLEQGESA